MMDDFVITRLDLSLCCYGGYGNSRQPDTIDRGHERIERVLRPDNHKDDDDCLPCLTLGLPDSITPTYSGKFNSGSPRSGASSMFSDSFLKLNKAEEGGAIDEGSPRKKLRLSKIQTSVLEDYFNANTTLNSRQKQDLADKLNLRPRQVEVWFQNRRARRKLKQTEADCELLRKCCETLEEDNARLKMELRKLKSTNHHDAEEPSTTSPVSFCPSCETGFQSPFSPIDRPS